MENQKTKNTFYLILYLIGVIAGLALTFIATWGDLEAAFYGFDRTGAVRLSSLSCPILMNNNEASSFSIKIKNSTDRKLSPSVKTDVSSRIAPISNYESVSLEPGETKTLSWEIGPENIDLNRFIFARAWVYASYPLKDREATCGVVILPLPIRGTAATWGLTGLSLLGMGIGLYGLKQVGGLDQSGSKISRFYLLAILAALGLIISYISMWLFGVVVLSVSLLVSVISVGYSIKL